MVLVSRSKLIPDFALTLHFLHLLVTSLYSRSVPKTWLWWALQVLSVGVMIALGVWSCQKRELRPIKFGGGAGAGVERGRGEYEMVGREERGDDGG